MHIRRIELENIKSHVDASFDFSPGTTAISGENGAGKTTLIEAVAWTLFDVLDYRKEDFVRRGAKRGVARVTFVSGLDERPYIVYRDTGTGYNVYDPALKMRVADKKDEVCRFLWQHLGVEPGTDLDSLYRRAIGVPQGTFTAIFLETPAERKKAFDKLLKVEEYRRGAEELLKTARYIEQQTVAVREKIARAEGEIARIDAVEEEHRSLVERVTEIMADAEKVEAQISEKQEAVAKLDIAEAALNESREELDRHKNDHTRSLLLLGQRDAEMQQARAAAVRIGEVKADFEKHTAAVLKLKELDRERVERDKLKNGLGQIEAALATVRADQKYSTDALEKALQAHATISSLAKDAREQERLDAELANLRQSAANLTAIRNQIASLDEKLNRLRESYRTNNAALAEATEKTQQVDGLPNLESRDAEIVRELASLHAALERDERFQKEIRDGLCPILSQKCLNLKEGETLEDFVTSQFTELRTRIAVLETEHGKVAVALKTSREAEKFLAQLATLKAREQEISVEGKQLREEKSALETQMQDLPQVQGDLERVEAALKALDNPKGKIQLLEVEVRREPDLRRKLSDIESNLERLESDRRITVEHLESYKDLDTQWAELTAVRDATMDANRVYLAHEALANSLGEREREFEAMKAESESAAKRVEEAESRYNSAAKGYDRERHSLLRAELIDLQKRHAELNTLRETATARRDELASELERLDEIRKTINEDFKEKDRLVKTAELTTFIRDTLKEAAPLVARNYVFHVSAEANLMFREITGNAEHTLKWAEDYGISLEERGYERPFVSLSGGEQMAAAIAVRLALLKQLTDIRIAFFDEPTTNMDAERRENLAMQLSQIRHFDQLFVISHDDTFEGYVDNVVTVERGEHEQPPQQMEFRA